MQSGATEANSALYANLAKPLFARFYGKLLIPRLGISVQDYAVVMIDELERAAHVRRRLTVGY